MTSSYAPAQTVGIDLHRRRSVIVRLDAEGVQCGKTARIANDPAKLLIEVAKAGKNPHVVIEATYGWYWAADTLAAAGAQVHLAHPLGVKMFTLRRVKNDEHDAHDLADLLRMHRLPEAWIAPPGIRSLRELVRHRRKLIGMRTGCKAQVHAVLAKCGVMVAMSDLFGAGGGVLLDSLALPAEYASRLASMRRLIDALNLEIGYADTQIAARLSGDPGYHAIQAIPGIGPVLAAVFAA